MRTFAENTALKAGKLLIKLQSQAQISKKKDEFGDIATTSDLASEKLIVNAISHKYPKHNIFSEELGLINHGSKYTWYVDPLDGTKEYARGLLQYAVLISCQNQTELVTAAAYLPPVDELYSAAKGGGAFLQNKAIRVSGQSELARSFVFSRFVGSSIREPEFSRYWAINKLLAKELYRLRAGYFEAQHLCWVARGAAEGVVMLSNYGPKWHDVAAGILIAQEAGATITNRHGKPLKLGDLSDGLVVSNGHIHQQLIDLINA